MKKLLALLMAVAVTFQLVTPVFADTEGTEETTAPTEAVVETKAPTEACGGNDRAHGGNDRAYRGNLCAHGGHRGN